ncbi:MAG: hypothetical protein DRI81_13415, partial [Chloroflexi bacterium]
DMHAARRFRQPQQRVYLLLARRLAISGVAKLAIRSFGQSPKSPQPLKAHESYLFNNLGKETRFLPKNLVSHQPIPGLLRGYHES